MLKDKATRRKFLKRGALFSLSTGLLGGLHSFPKTIDPSSKNKNLGTLKAGFGEADITPAVGTPMSGYPQVRKDLPWAPDAMKGYVGRQGVSEGIHDPLMAVALAMEAENARAVVIGLDTLLTSLEFTNQVRTALKDSGVPPENVLIGASHTHSGPDLFGWWEAGPHGVPAPNTARGAIEAARRALAHMEPATLSWGTQQINDLSINRRDEKHGPSDPTVSVVKVSSDQTGAVLGLLVNFACHPVTLDYRNLLFSADYVWSLRSLVGVVYGSASCAFLQGCAGNINPARFPYEQHANIYIPQTLEHYPVYWGGYADTKRFGTILGATAVQAAERALPIKMDDIHGIRKQVELPIKQGKDLAAFLDFMNFTSTAYRKRLASAHSLPSEVHRLSLGGLTIIGLPGEPFVELDLEIKAAHGSKSPMFVAGYANDDVRYVLTDDAYVAGQYETVGTPLAAGSAPRLVAAAKELLGPGSAPHTD